MLSYFSSVLLLWLILSCSSLFFPLIAKASHVFESSEVVKDIAPRVAKDTDTVKMSEASSGGSTEPFAWGDFTWVPGNYSPTEHPLATKYFIPEIRIDTTYTNSFNNPEDNTLSGSHNVARHGEFQLTQIGVGGDLAYKNVAFRLMTQIGMYSEVTPSADASPARGQWFLDTAYRYVSEAYGSYHLDVWNGINLQVGIFVSYVGLWSYYNFNNWTYQPSYVSEFTPWYFNGARAQIFPNDKVKVEVWVINGWQAYGKFNNLPGFGSQVLYRPNSAVSLLGNYYYGTDTLDTPSRKRIHSDQSAMVKYYEKDAGIISRAAASVTVDAGCETGGGVTCGSQYFLGFMAYHRLWFLRNQYALTVGGGAISNPGRYLVTLPPVNGANAISGTPYFTENPGDSFWAWDTQITADYMPTQNITFRMEFTRRWANVPYFTGSGGITPPGGNTGTPGSLVAGWTPDLVQAENRISGAMLILL